MGRDAGEAKQRNGPVDPHSRFPHPTAAAQVPPWGPESIGGAGFVDPRGVIEPMPFVLLRAPGLWLTCSPPSGARGSPGGKQKSSFRPVSPEPSFPHLSVLVPFPLPAPLQQDSANIREACHPPEPRELRLEKKRGALWPLSMQRPPPPPPPFPGVLTARSLARPLEELPFLGPVFWERDSQACHGLWLRSFCSKMCRNHTTPGSLPRGGNAPGPLRSLSWPGSSPRTPAPTCLPAAEPLGAPSCWLRRAWPGPGQASSGLRDARDCN